MGVTSATLEKLPPSNVDAEQAVLGGLLLDQAALDLVKPFLKPADFFRDAHRVAYEAILHLERDHKPRDIVTLTDELERHGQLASVGGPAYIHSLPTVVPTAIHIEHYGRIVQRTALKRRLISAAGHIAQMAYDDGLEAEDSIDRALATLVALTDHRHERQAGIFELVDLSEAIDDLYERGLKPGESTGWPELDGIYRVRRGEWTAVTGMPSSGKSEWLDALLVNLARGAEWRFAVCSPENQPLARHAAKLAEKWAEQPFRDGLTPRMGRDTLVAAKSWLHDHFTFILPDEHQLTVDGVLGLAKVQHALRPIDGLVIDPWNELDHHRPDRLSETEYISDALTRVRRFARQHQIHVWLVAHPTKLQRSSDGTYPVPTLYDMAGSAHWRNKADNGVTVHRDLSNPSDSRVQIHVQKVRFRENGRMGVTELHWDAVTGSYYSLGQAS